MLLPLLQFLNFVLPWLQVGYLVRASPDVYGVHLSNFNLSDAAIGMLADPVNAVSDNNLQVSI